MGVVDGSRLRGLRESACELMMLNLKLVDPMFGIQGPVAPRFPTAVDFFASLL